MIFKVELTDKVINNIKNYLMKLYDNIEDEPIENYIQFYFCLPDITDGVDDADEEIKVTILEEET